MDVVVAHLIAPEGVIPAGVDGAGVAGFQNHPIKLIIGDLHLVAPEHDGRVGAVVDQVVPGLHAHADHMDARMVALGSLRDLVNVVVVNFGVQRFQSATVAAVKQYAVVAAVVDGAVLHRDPVTLVNVHGSGSHLLHHAVVHLQVFAEFRRNDLAAGPCKGKPPNGNVPAAAQGDHRLS